MAREEPTAISRMTRGFIVLLCVTLVGIAGYLVTGWSLLDSVYMVVITIFGVGYGEVRNIDSTELKLFTMGLIISGCSAGETIERPALDVPLEPGDRVILITHEQDAHSISLRFPEKAKRVTYRGATLHR